MYINKNVFVYFVESVPILAVHVRPDDRSNWRKAADKLIHMAVVELNGNAPELKNEVEKKVFEPNMRPPY